MKIQAISSVQADIRNPSLQLIPARALRNAANGTSFTTCLQPNRMRPMPSQVVILPADDAGIADTSICGKIPGTVSNHRAVL